MALVWLDLANVPLATSAEVGEPGHRLPGQSLWNPGENCKSASLKGQRCTRRISAQLVSKSQHNQTLVAGHIPLLPVSPCISGVHRLFQTS